MNKITLNKLNTYVISDIHGAFEVLDMRLRTEPMMENCNLIIAGDIGLGFSRIDKTKDIISKISKICHNKNIHIYLIRGNHDDPKYFNENLINTDYIQTISDYTVLEINGKHILCVGGAISIDRRMRKRKYEEKIYAYVRLYNEINKKNNNTIYSSDLKRKVNDAINGKLPKGYWEDEIPIYKEELLDELKENNININYVITHTSPSFAFKSDKNDIEYFLVTDAKLSEDLENERDVFNKIYNKLLEDEHPLKEWIYGHFHVHHEETINNISFITLRNADFIWDIKEININ